MMASLPAARAKRTGRARHERGFRSRRGPVSSADAVMMRRAARRIGGQAAGLVLVAFCLCAGVLLAMVWRSQHQASSATLAAAVQRADDVSDPPNGAWLVVARASGVTDVSPGAPPVVPDRSALARVQLTGLPDSRDVHTPSGEYHLLTEPQDGRIVQAALSLAPEHGERTRLLEALAVAGGVAVAAAGALGALAGHRSVAPLAAALARQRSFVADASHELRTPLTRLTTRAQLLQRTVARGDVADAEAEARRLVVDGRELTAVLEDLLAAAEPVDQASWAAVDLVAVADYGRQSMLAEAAAAGVELAVQGHPPAGKVTVRAPRSALDRAMVALLDNAVRHTPAGGTVTVAVTRAGRWATLSVGDTGPGVPAEMLGRLFDRFAHGTAHGPRRRFGLGLALVADTAHRLGGDIGVATGSGGGTTMTMRLPVENRRTAQEPDAPGVPGRPGPGGLRGGAPTQDLT
jgi:two-component system OmpR family sensor kinase